MIVYKELKKEILTACFQMKEYRLISLSGGNISVRAEKNRYLVTPSGMNYEDMKEDDIVLVDGEGNLIEGDRRPSSDLAALLYIFKHRPKINAIIHTHQPYATAVGLVADKLPACLVNLIDAVHGDVMVAPWTRSSDIGMGKLCIEYGNGANAIIMKHHGVIGYGKSLEEALFSVVYLEEGAKTYCMARMMGTVAELSKKEVMLELSGMEHYGQI